MVGERCSCRSWYAWYERLPKRFAFPSESPSLPKRIVGGPPHASTPSLCVDARPSMRPCADRAHFQNRHHLGGGRMLGGLCELAGGPGVDHLLGASCGLLLPLLDESCRCLRECDQLASHSRVVTVRFESRDCRRDLSEASVNVGRCAHRQLAIASILNARSVAPSSTTNDAPLNTEMMLAVDSLCGEYCNNCRSCNPESTATVQSAPPPGGRGATFAKATPLVWNATAVSAGISIVSRNAIPKTVPTLAVSNAVPWSPRKLA